MISKHVWQLTWWTKTSWPPSSGVTNPHPFATLNHLHFPLLRPPPASTTNICDWNSNIHHSSSRIKKCIVLYCIFINALNMNVEYVNYLALGIINIKRTFLFLSLFYFSSFFPSCTNVIFSLLIYVTSDTKVSTSIPASKGSKLPSQSKGAFPIYMYNFEISLLNKNGIPIWNTI